VLIIEMYEYLRKQTQQSLPKLCLSLEFVISTKSILNIKGWTIPFMAVLLASRSSMKTIALDIFIDYPYTFTTEEFTLSSFVSHNSALEEEQLHKVNMLLRWSITFIPNTKKCSCHTYHNEKLITSWEKSIAYIL
jgi:hypothetical protein